MKESKIFILILHYKAYDQLSMCLADLNKLTKPENSIINFIVVDNESNRNELLKVKAKYPNVTFLAQKSNLGVPAGFNVGLKYSYNHNANFIMMLSPDLKMEKDVLCKLVNKMRTDSNIGIASTKMLLKTTPPRIFFVQGKLDSKRKSTIHIGLGKIDKGQYDHTLETDFVNLPLVVKREVLKKIGYLNPKFFMYYEDIEWEFRVRKAGYQLFCVKDAISWNLNPSDLDDKSLNKEYYCMRNLLYFVSESFPLKERIIAYLFITKDVLISIINNYRTFQNKKTQYKLQGIFDFIKKTQGKRNINFSA